MVALMGPTGLYLTLVVPTEVVTLMGPRIQTHTLGAKPAIAAVRVVREEQLGKYGDLIPLQGGYYSINCH